MSLGGDHKSVKSHIQFVVISHKLSHKLQVLFLKDAIDHKLYTYVNFKLCGFCATFLLAPNMV